jgi:hypothetical protein
MNMAHSAKLTFGQILCCKVIEKAPGGYRVHFDDYACDGILPTNKELKPGDELDVYYVCVDKGGLLVSLNPSNR